jgi:PAS domain S-box-containing protein
MIHPDDHVKLSSIPHLNTVNDQVAFEYRIVRPDQNIIWVRDHIFPIRSATGDVVGLHGAVQDITAQRSMEESLRKEQEKLRGIIENSADGIALFDESAKMIVWSPAMERITGLPQEEVINSYYWDIHAKLSLPEEHERHDVRAQTRALLERYLRDGTSRWVQRLFDRWILRPDGERRFIEMVAFPVKSSQGMLTGSVTRDITEVKLSELDLEERNRQLQTLIQAIPDLVYFKDGSLRNIIANQAYADYLEQPIEKVVGKTDREILPPDIAEQCEQSDRDVVEHGIPVRREEEAESSKANGYTYFETLKVPLLDAEGTVTGLVGVSRDITERKVAELLLAQQNKELKERNQELDTYTHSVAHDLKNPLSLILGYAEMVQSERNEMSPEELNTYMGSILFSGRKMISIINSLLLLASVRQEDITLEYLDMQQIVDDAVRRLQKRVAEQHVEIVMPDTWFTTMGHATWIEEVWVNYIGNAIKHGGDGLRIEIGMADEGEMIRYWVKDNGIGIPKDSLKDLFLPFKRLSQAKIEGHGLGLSIVRRIIEKIGGEVGVQSEEGVGSIFSFTLPKT